jgi:NADH:ubiquinone oxidoreductase subunit F (NADH-binding)
VQQVTDSGLRGRGGAAFPTGIKWNTVRATTGSQKYIVCNADEGDSGTFSDRMVMEDDPFMLIEGMTIAGLAVGANKGYIYVRSEYPHAIVALNEAITIARNAQYLGANILGSGKAFDLEVRMGAGSYVCGEETALLESLEGKRGIVRAKPPLPAISGLFGKPTVINNVISLASVPIIFCARCRVLSRLRHGSLARHFADSNRGQRQARRSGRESFWHHAARNVVRLRWRHTLRQTNTCSAGRWTIRCVSAAITI